MNQQQQITQLPSPLAGVDVEGAHGPAGFEELQIAFVAEGHGIDIDLTRELVARLGINHPDLDLEAEKIAQGRSTVMASHPKPTR